MFTIFVCHNSIVTYNTNAVSLKSVLLIDALKATLVELAML